jgi:hypothetical protein
VPQLNEAILFCSRNCGAGPRFVKRKNEISVVKVIPTYFPKPSCFGLCGTSDTKAENSITWLSACEDVFGKLAASRLNVRVARQLSIEN